MSHSIRKLNADERLGVHVLAELPSALRSARRQAQDLFLARVHEYVCRGVSLREIAFAAYGPLDIAASVNRLKDELRRWRERTGHAPCQPRPREPDAAL